MTELNTDIQPHTPVAENSPSIVFVSSLLYWLFGRPSVKVVFAFVALKTVLWMRLSFTTCDLRVFVILS